VVDREFDSRPSVAKTLQIGTAAFLPGARCADDLLGTHPEHKNKPEFVHTRSWRYKTTVVIKRQEQTTMSNKQLENKIEMIVKRGFRIVENQFFSRKPISLHD